MKTTRSTNHVVSERICFLSRMICKAGLPPRHADKKAAHSLVRSGDEPKISSCE
jgi:hypothetical protein